MGIIAVDPSSPFSGGALLGDRIRMQEHAGLTCFWDKVIEHKTYLENNGLLQRKREERLKLEVMEYVEAELRQRIRQRVLDSPEMTEILGQINQGQLTTYTAAEQILSLSLEKRR